MKVSGSTEDRVATPRWVRPGPARAVLASIGVCIVISTSTLPGQAFVDVAASQGVMVPGNNGAVGLDRGVAFGDFDRDGDLDLIALGTPGAPNRYFRRDGGVYTDLSATLPLGVSTLARCIATADVDNDGDLDVYVGVTWNTNRFYLNDGTGQFTEVSGPAGLASPRNTMAITFGDYDRDGFLDVYLGNHIEPSGQPGANQLLRNLGNGTFQDVTATAGVGDTGFAFAVAFHDYDEDGWPDLFVGNDGGDLPGIAGNTTYRNLGNGTFANVGASIGTDQGIRSMGVDFLDVFNDGGVDLFVTNVNVGHVFLVWDPTLGRYVDQAAAFGVVGYDLGWALHFFDYDNDGFADLYVNHSPTDGDPGINRLWRNPGSPGPVWNDVAPGLGLNFGGRKYTSAVADFDDDGDLDLFQLPYTAPGRLLRNPAAGTTWLRVSTVGTRSNRDGIGTRVDVTVNGMTQRQQVRSGVGFLSQNDLRLHFGLGGATVVPRIDVTWPSGQRQSLYGVAANQELTLVEPSLGLSAPAVTGTTPDLELRCGNDPLRPCLFALCLSPQPGIPLPDGRVLPITLDVLFELAWDPSYMILTAPFGILDANGAASSPLGIPAGPFAGFSFTAVAITTDPLWPSGIRTIVDPLTIVLQ